MKRIAVVEDEVYMREELCNMLQKDGYLADAITEFEDAARLLAALRLSLIHIFAYAKGDYEKEMGQAAVKKEAIKRI